MLGWRPPLIREQPPASAGEHADAPAAAAGRLALVGVLAVVGEAESAAERPLDRIQRRTPQRNRKLRNNNNRNKQQQQEQQEQQERRRWPRRDAKRLRWVPAGVNLLLWRVLPREPVL